MEKLYITDFPITRYTLMVYNIAQLNIRNTFLVDPMLILLQNQLHLPIRQKSLYSSERNRRQTIVIFLLLPHPSLIVITVKTEQKSAVRSEITLYQNTVYHIVI